MFPLESPSIRVVESENLILLLDCATIRDLSFQPPNDNHFPSVFVSIRWFSLLADYCFDAAKVDKSLLSCKFYGKIL